MVRLRCLFGHRWQTFQVGIDTSSGHGQIVIAWHQCTRCAKSKLIHILGDKP